MEGRKEERSKHGETNNVHVHVHVYTSPKGSKPYTCNCVFSTDCMYGVHAYTMYMYMSMYNLHSKMFMYMFLNER